MLHDVCMCNVFLLILRIAIFSVTVLKEERVIVVAEQKPNCTDEVVCTFL